MRWRNTNIDDGASLRSRLLYGPLRWSIYLAAFFFGAGATALGWYALRPHPEPVEGRVLFQGVTHTRRVWTDPRPQVLNLVTVDLKAPGIRWQVTPRAFSGPQSLAGQITGEFLERHELKVAINGGFFEPFHSKWPWDYYPKPGEPVRVLGLSMADGEIVSSPTPGYGSLFISKEGALEIALEPPWPESQIAHAISGREILVKEGQLIDRLQRISRPKERHPRTAVGLDATRTRALLLVADGRQWRYADGLTLSELGEALIEAGAHTALLLDGGGSTTMVMADEGGDAKLLNSPAHTRIPGRQRPVANHLGVDGRP